MTAAISSEVKHLRDNSKFLAPNGLRDLGFIAGDYPARPDGRLPGLLLTVMLPLATVLILAYLDDGPS